MVSILGEVVTQTDMALFFIAFLVLILPFKVKIVEHNLEVFLFIMGAAAVTVTNKWTMEVIMTAAEEPIVKGIVPAVLVAGFIFLYGQKAFQKFMDALVKKMNLGIIIFVSTFILGLICSVITAIISSLFLCEIANTLPLDRKNKINYVIIACFAIGLGAVLTPLGEPLSTIAISKLSGEPIHDPVLFAATNGIGPGNAGFFYLFDQLGILIILGVLLCSAFAMFYIKPTTGKSEKMGSGEEGSVREVLIRTLKVYAFVAALFLLGAGMEVIIFKYLTKVPDYILFWVNMISAILDNATLTAAEISKAMTQKQINAALYGLLISGGMLIPGNIPNIISAGKLGITSSEWAKLGVPFGLVLNALYFVVVFVLGINPTIGL
jgi:predicted cation transporter